MTSILFTETTSFRYPKWSFDFYIIKTVLDHCQAFFSQSDSKGTRLRKDPAVVAVQEMGYQIEDILPIADSLKQDGEC